METAKAHSEPVGHEVGKTDKGKITAEIIVPDKKSDAIMMRMDRNGDGRADVIYFDFQRRNKWDLSLRDENFDGHWTLVGYHADGSLIPTSFESYAVRF